MQKLGLIALVFLLFSQSSFSQELSGAAIYSRCYSQLTGHTIHFKNPVLLKLKSERGNGVTACLQLADQIQLSNHKVDPNNKEQVWMLNNFYSFFRTWFPIGSVESIPEYTEELSKGTADVYDSSESSLALLYNLFNKGEKYQDVLRYNSGFVASRQESPHVKARYSYTNSFPGRRIYGNSLYGKNNYQIIKNELNSPYNGTASNTNFVSIPPIEIGELVGVRPQDQSQLIPNFSPTPLTGESRGADMIYPGLINYSFDIYKSYGGGVLGLPIYLMLNLGHGKNTKFNGSTKLPRAWIYNSLKTFMCTSFPSLREADVINYYVGNSSAPFRNSTSCLKCHSTLDQAASTGRNLISGTSDFAEIQSEISNGSKVFFTISSFKPSINSINTWPSEPVADYHLQQPTGKLYIRSFTGKLINKPVSNISELGAAVSSTDDYYQCVAKRYFEYFTGIEVALYDRQDSRYSTLNKTLSPSAAQDRVFVESLAENMKSHQSQVQLIKEIISSDYYKNINFRKASSVQGSK